MFVYGFMFKMHPIVYLLIGNNMGGFGGQNGVYAARFAGDRGADIYPFHPSDLHPTEFREEPCFWRTTLEQAQEKS